MAPCPNAKSMSVPLTRAERLKKQTEEEILQAAFETFSEKGYHQTAISDIAQKLGMGHGTFYRYFKNKRDIIERVFEWKMEEVMALLMHENAPDAVDSLQDYIDQVMRIRRRLIDYGRQNLSALRLLFLASTAVDDDLSKKVYELIRFGGLLCSGYMLNGTSKKFFRPDLKQEGTAEAIVGMIVMGGIHLINTQDQPEWIERYADSVVDLLVCGLKDQTV